MSISYCGECDRVVEGETHQCDCGENDLCNFCDGTVKELPDPALDKFRQVADRIGDK